MEFEMSRFKQLLIEAVGGATFGGHIKSADMGKIGRRLAMANVNFNASEFKKMPAKSFRFSSSRMIFTKMAKKEHDEVTLVAIEPNENIILVMLVNSRGDYRVIYCNVGELATFTKNKFVGYGTHRTVPVVVEAGNRIEEVINNPETIFYVAENSTEDHDELHAKKSDREAAKEGEDRLLKLNRKIKRRVNIINSVAFKKLSAVAKEAGYRVDNLVKERFQYDNGHEYVYLNVSISRASNEDFLPSIYIDRDKKNKENNKLVATIQTTSWGSMSVEDVEKVIQGYQKALKVAKAINNIKVEEMADFLANDEM